MRSYQVLTGDLASMPQSLEVHQVQEQGVLKDMARIHVSHRKGIEVGRIVKLTANKHSTWVSARGLDTNSGSGNSSNKSDWIRLDDITRERLGNLSLQQRYEFQIEPATIWGHIRWAMRASDPAARVSILIAIWSAFLSTIVGALLGWVISRM